MAYLDLDAFKLRTIMPSGYIDAIERVEPGWTVQQLESWSLSIDARLRKRYSVPFAEDATPETVKQWLTQIVTKRAWLKHGVDPQDPQWPTVENDYDTALAELKEAADGNEGLLDLPLLDTADTSAVTKQATRGYSEHSPYVGFDQQAAIGRGEDCNGGGTFT